MSISGNSIDSLDIQIRDLALLRGLFESRIMTASHIGTIYFNGKKEYAKKRLQKLKAAGLIAERRRRTFEPSILFLNRKSFRLLKERGILEDYPRFSVSSLEKRACVSDRTIGHELEVMDVKVAFHFAVKSNDKLSVAEFTTWPLLCEFQVFRPGRSGREVPVKPDGFIRIQEKGNHNELFEHNFFLELDRSGESQNILVGKANSYLDYYKSGGFAVRNGDDRLNFKDFPFRVLMILKNPERRNNTAACLLQNRPPILTQVYLSTFQEVLADPFGKVWIRPIDYRNATSGTPFEPKEQRQTWGYKRQTAREIFVEQKIQKHSILDD